MNGDGYISSRDEVREELETPHVVSYFKEGALTSIELLVVIAIISLLAALVVPLAKVATTKMRISRVTAELNHYANAIENYKQEAGEYPPDNPLLKTLQTNNPSWKTNAAMHPLYYELSGA